MNTNWTAFIPEIFYFASAMVFVFMAMNKRQRARKLYLSALWLSAAGLIVSLGCVQQQARLFVGTYQIDLFSQVFKVLLAMGLFLVVCACSRLEGVDEHWHAEFYMLLFTSTLAMMLLSSAVHLVSIYISLELSSYSLYILVALRRQKAFGLEAALKYFLIGVTASAIMLFGMALLYGATGATYISDLVRQVPLAIGRPMAVAALVLTFCGFFFKLAVFPFHFWAPDVYQGAPNQLAAFIATVSKAAAVAILLRVVVATSQESRILIDLLVYLAVISMTVGNLAAIAQKDFKRLLAYSSIAHAGYVLIGILCMTPDGAGASLFYALSLVIMKFTCFLALILVAENGDNLDIRQLAGLHYRSPLLAMALMLALFGLAGIPPTVGFTAKLLIFTAAVHQGYLILVLIAMFNVVISLYYYLSAVKAAYLLEPEPGRQTFALNLSRPVQLLTTALVAAMVIAGIFPSQLIELARAAAVNLF
jgi:NADH-quinone oxidoreductase subunit N